ncbi:MAG TPA: DUF72 domain-containing protein [Burkholderiaceae bacterium]|nr:DUF72 domain-containing protein [Burkholderiaceae bacterium]
MPILVGTASWSSKSLVDSARFYPPGVTSAEARLRYYASRFPLVEVDSSYYAVPSAATAQLWAERTPDDFTMNVKAFRLFTGHQTSPTVLHRDLREALPASPKKMLYERDMPGAIVDELWRRFIEALVPLRAAGRLALVHFQFAPWVLRDAAGHALVRRCVERMAGHTLSVEFRHRSWFDGPAAGASTLAFERELGVVHTVVDGPQGFANSVPAVWEATHPAFALVRLHGRNAQTWNLKGAVDSSERFNYDYGDDELAALAAEIKRLAERVRTTHVVFNNNMEDQGQRNAGTLMRLLAD